MSCHGLYLKRMQGHDRQQRIENVKWGCTCSSDCTLATKSAVVCAAVEDGLRGIGELLTTPTSLSLFFLDAFSLRPVSLTASCTVCGASCSVFGTSCTDCRTSCSDCGTSGTGRSDGLGGCDAAGLVVLPPVDALLFFAEMETGAARGAKPCAACLPALPCTPPGVLLLRFFPALTQVICACCFPPTTAADAASPADFCTGAELFLAFFDFGCEECQQAAKKRKIC